LVNKKVHDTTVDFWDGLTSLLFSPECIQLAMKVPDDFVIS